MVSNKEVLCENAIMTSKKAFSLVCSQHKGYYDSVSVGINPSPLIRIRADQNLSVEVAPVALAACCTVSLLIFRQQPG